MFKQMKDVKNANKLQEIAAFFRFADGSAIWNFMLLLRLSVFYGDTIYFMSPPVSNK